MIPVFLTELLGRTVISIYHIYIRASFIIFLLDSNPYQCNVLWLSTNLLVFFNRCEESFQSRSDLLFPIHFVLSWNWLMCWLTDPVKLTVEPYICIEVSRLYLMGLFRKISYRVCTDSIIYVGIAGMRIYYFFFKYFSEYKWSWL